MENVNLNNLRNGNLLTLKTTFFVHFILISWALFGSWGITSSYLFYNSVFMFLYATGILFKEKYEPLEMAEAVNLISAIFDIIYVIWIPSARVFVRVGCLLNMLLRILSHFIIHKEVTARKEGAPSSFYGSGPYQNIDDTGPPV